MHIYIMRKFELIIFAFLTLSVFSNAQNTLPETQQKITSPDGAYEFSIYQKSNGYNTKQIYYTLTYKGKPVVLESELGVLIENNTFESALGVPNDTCKIWGENLSFTGIQRDTINKTWTPVYGEYAQISDNYNEMTLFFRKGETKSSKISDGYDKNKSYFMNVVVRAYKEGVAVRYHFPEPSNGLFLHITGEQTQFTMPEGTLAYYEPWAQGPYSLLPLKDWQGQSERPLTMKLTNGLIVAIAEAQMTDYARMKFSLNATKTNTLQANIYGSVDVTPAYSTPWRVIMAAEKPIELIANNTIILNLNPDNKIKDVSWIKPGKVIRITKMTQADALKYIDFAADRGLQYVHLDAGWYGPEMQMSSSALKVSEKRDLNIAELVKYASSKGIGLWVYVNQRALSQELDSILPLYKKWGVKGIKFGFVQVGNQRWTTWLHKAVIKCAEYGIMVDIHDEYRPTGFSRTYPNLMTQEGVRGNEEFPDATHNTILPFTRYLAGPADYTICYYSEKLKNTHAHQLALSVVNFSPIQFLYWYDNPSQYKGEPETEFFNHVKTVWDDTRVLNGEPGEFITTARRSGDEWFVGTLTNNDARTISVPLAFLSTKQKYVAKVYTDDDNITTKTKVGISTFIVTAKTVLNLNLKARGGAAVYIVPATKDDLKKIRVFEKKRTSVVD